MEANCPGRRKANEQKDTLRGRTASGVLPFTRQGGILPLPGTLGVFFAAVSSQGRAVAGSLTAFQIVVLLFAPAFDSASAVSDTGCSAAGVRLAPWLE